MSMHVFIREQLTLNVNTTLDEVVPHCIKLQAWLMEYQDEVQSQTQLQLSQPLVECLVKAHLYLYECQDRFGKTLTDRCDAGQRFWSRCSKLEDRQERIRELCSSIVNTQNGHEYAAQLYVNYKSLGDIQAGWSIIKELDWSQMRASESHLVAPAVEINTHLKQMRCLVRRICRLASTADIEIALQRSMRLIKFDVWLHLFREPRHSSIYSQCYILRHMICDWLLQGGEEDGHCSSFVHNIFEFVMKPSNEKRFWLCLDNRRLADSLFAYITGYWKRHLPSIDMDNMQLSQSSITNMTLPLDEVLYLTHLMFAPKSPSRQQIYMQLRSTLISCTFLRLKELLNKVAFVYN
ncbi:uncharacterized protein [Drosophila tropicalis]|uniref:uncharacterized protein n=1 Tax=Drosophila tropicalis TaxID=46794 RepID=UPI0035ABD69D